jgi:uncharacterized protein (TIGR03435 family)
MRSVLLVLMAGVAWGQAPEFEVASIHPTPPDVRMAGISTAGGEFKAQNVSVRRLIEHAYDLRPFQLKGGPGWIDTGRYTIVAKSAASEEEARVMLQRLLADRFGLQLHRTTEEQRVHALVVTDQSRLHPTKNPEQTFATIAPEDGGRLRVKFSSYALMNLAAALSREMEQMVVDETGLTGLFDIEFTLEGALDGPAPPPIRFVPALPDFGLKLVSRRGPVEIYTIEAVERPSEN